MNIWKHYAQVNSELADQTALKIARSSVVWMTTVCHIFILKKSKTIEHTGYPETTNATENNKCY